MRAIAGALLVAAALAMLPNVALAAPPPNGTPYEINAILPLTGPGAFLGNAFQQSLRAAELVVNGTGGIAGRPLKFVVADSASSAATSLQLVNGLIAKKVPVILDGGPSGICNATIALVQKTGPVEYCLSSSVYPDANGFAFSAGVPTPALTENLIRYLRLRGWTKLGLITGTDATGSDFDSQIARVLALPENAGVKLVAHEHFNVSDLTAAAQIARLKAAAPQAVLTWSTGTPFGTLLHGIKDAGLDLPIVGVPSNQNLAEMQQYATVLPRELYFPSSRGAAKNGTGKGPVRDAQLTYYEAFEKIGSKPDFVTNIAWDPAMIVISAIRAIGPNATADQIRDYIRHLHSWAGVNGIYDFRDGSQRGIGANAGNIQRWDAKLGDFVAVSKPMGYLP